MALKSYAILYIEMKLDYILIDMQKCKFKNKLSSLALYNIKKRM